MIVIGYGEIANPLGHSLSPEQVCILEQTWLPIPQSYRWDDKDVQNWPKWDYVVHQFYDHFPGSDADEVLASLPSIRRPLHQQSYGLVWRSEQSESDSELNGLQIGLTIAGIAALAAASPDRIGAERMLVANRFAQVAGAIVEWDTRREPHPYRTKRVTAPLAMFTSWFTNPGPYGKAYPISDRVVAGVLMHEYAGITVLADSPSSYLVWSGARGARTFHGVADAADYLSRIATMDAAAQPTPPFASPLTLVQTLDYLALVLAADPVWPNGLRLVNAPDLQSAAAISAVVANRHEFETSMNGLLNVINDLGVPDIPANVVSASFNNKQPPSMMRLEYWLQQRLAHTDGAPRALAALTVLRAARRIRVEGAHSNEATRREAAAARRRLDVPEVIADWSDAWQTIQARIAGAFDAIRQEVQGAPTEAETE